MGSGNSAITARPIAAPTHQELENNVGNAESTRIDSIRTDKDVDMLVFKLATLKEAEVLASDELSGIQSPSSIARFISIMNTISHDFVAYL